MTYEYSAENHDWDLTLRAAGDLLTVARLLSPSPTNGSFEFSQLTGSMLLSFCAIESFSASVAFCMDSDGRFNQFDFEQYKRTPRFWEKIELLCSALSIKVDKSQGIFQRIHEMQDWRNLVTHASPYRVEPTEVKNTTGPAIHKLHTPYRRKEFTRTVSLQSAKKFLDTAIEYVQLLETTSGIKPRAQACYTPTKNERTTR